MAGYFNEIHAGGPPRDGIPSIDRPRFVDADDADRLKAADRVLGLDLNGVVKAYPIGILNRDFWPKPPKVCTSDQPAA
jgi:hypothetical protein